MTHHIQWHTLYKTNNNDKIRRQHHLLSENATELMTNRQIIDQGLRHRVIALTGTLQDRPFVIQSVCAPVEHNRKAQFFIYLSRDTEPILIVGDDMNYFLDGKLDYVTQTQQSNHGTEHL